MSVWVEKNTAAHQNIQNETIERQLVVWISNYVFYLSPRAVVSCSMNGLHNFTGVEHVCPLLQLWQRLHSTHPVGA